jgi:hypothetical protein
VTPSTVGSLDSPEFVEGFLRPGRPVVVRGALTAWSAAPPWDLGGLTERFGDYPVPIYDTLFSLQQVASFRDYVAAHTGSSVRDVPPYLRWFTRQSRDRLPWADRAFTELADEWAMPSWLPDADYVFPATRGRADASRDAFPAKGLFVCGAGGRTRLHVDPWASDACLCQVTGSKRFIMYPAQARDLLTAGNATVDLDNPDERRFPRWRDATAVLDEVLHPGDAIYIPAGWFHTAIALSDSVSITWNFVHRTNEDRFVSYLRSGGAADPTVAFFRAARGRSG